MYDYMKALQARFVEPYTDTTEPLRKEISAVLDKENRKKLLRLVDEELQLVDDYGLQNFISGFALARSIMGELKDNRYSFEAEDEERARKQYLDEEVN